jgi:hypothetical protein
VVSNQSRLQHLQPFRVRKMIATIAIKKATMIHE